MADLRTSVLCGLIAAGFCATALPAAAQERWTVIDDEARIVLPAAGGSHKVERAELVCAERLWSLAITLAEPAPAQTDVAARLEVGTFAIDATGRLDGPALTIAVPVEALGPIKAGTRLGVSLADGDLLGAPAFPLRGSRLAIDQAAASCTDPDMSAYEAVAFSESEDDLALARDLRGADIDAFRQATASDAKVTVGEVAMGGDGGLVFVQLCGSSWYYGASGCSLTGHLREDDGWRVVFESEGASLYIDRSAELRGFPGLVTLPALSAFPVNWSWTGGAYRQVRP